MKLFFVITLLIFSVVSPSYGGFKITYDPKLFVTAEGQVSAAATDTVKTAGNVHHVKYQKPVLNGTNKLHPLFSFLSGLVGIACAATFVVLLIHALPIAWLFLAAGAILGVLAIYLGFNSPKGYHLDLVVLGCIMGFIAAIPVYPLLLVAQLVFGITQGVKRRRRRRHAGATVN